MEGSGLSPPTLFTLGPIAVTRTVLDSVVASGVLVALASFATFEWVGAAYYLLAGVLIGNIWEAWHRWLFSRPRLPSTAT